MSIHASAREYLDSFAFVSEWPELRAMFGDMAEKETHAWSLPYRVGAGYDADLKHCVPAAAAIGCAQLSIILIDDILDEDPRGKHHKIGLGAAVNLASGFQAAAMQSLARAGLGERVNQRGMEYLNEMLLKTCLGQEKDAQNPDDEAAYWEMVALKSSPFYGCAFVLGALSAGASEKERQASQALGELYGEMIQINDDLHDSMSVPAGPDWLQNRNPLPLLFAQVVDHPARERFLELRTMIEDGEALDEAQTILIQCGAVSYCLHAIILRYRQAKDAVREMGLSNPKPVEELLDHLVVPIRELAMRYQVDID